MRPYCFTIQECCRYIGLKRTSIYKLINQGKLQKIKVSGRTLVTLSSLDTLLREADDKDRW